MDDPFQTDPTTKRWVEHVLAEMVPKMKDSALVMQIVPKPEHAEGDVKFWVELGASIMMNKPIIAIAFAHEQIPPKLRQIADEIVILPEGVGPEASDALAAATKRVVQRLDDGEL